MDIFEAYFFGLVTIPIILGLFDLWKRIDNASKLRVKGFFEGLLKRR